MMKISEVARHSGLTPHTLRFYEKNGLLSPSQRTDAGYRLYSRDDLRKAEFIRTARNIGFSLEEISLLLSIRLDLESHSCQEITDIAQRKLTDVNNRIAELRGMQKTLQTLIRSCCGGPEAATHCSIMEALDDRSTSPERAVVRRKRS